MRRVRRRGGNKEKVFGCDLLEHLNASSQEIPQVLKSCSEFVEQHGIVDGIYRLSGVSSNIQKLRCEFENDANPDLNKDVYLQDIHCVSSLCKAYFRELPNPLLTYQLYDKYAEAVAIQLEEERLVKIRDVLKELPTPHYRTLEFLMRHLVKMASYSSETNMHARNLAIVWAPNLLRSKDIEVSGFNGTAAFMEVRVQSIVVEFILTHVPQLFPDKDASNERRKSLPSATTSSQEDGLFKPIVSQPVTSFGNISPGHGPLAMRPYHAIIEGTDKRKGSLKGKKWMSIFNIGGRFPDPRRKHKASAKEKDRPALRPARSMDSLSTPSYPNEGPRRSAQRPPSTSMSPLVTASPKPGTDVAASAGAISGSEYAVTYRRGTGLVSGGSGTQGTYTALDPEGLGVAGNESFQPRSPGLSTKAGRRAAMHITGPTMVTVPLHITSNLALGVLQGGGADRVVHRSRDKDGGDRGEAKEGGEKVDRKDKDVEEGMGVEEEEKNPRSKERPGVVDIQGNTVVAGGGEEEKDEGANETEEEREDCRRKPGPVVRGVSREQRARSFNSNTNVEDNDDYIVMKGVEPAEDQPAATQRGDDSVFDAPDLLNSTTVEGDDHELSGYVQDNFEFLDHMDCSMSFQSGFASQVNEFSVEPPGHSDDEYELMAQSQLSAELQALRQPGPEAQHSHNELNPHRPLSLDLNNCYTKSLSLPYITSPVHGLQESCSSEEEEDPGDCSDDEYSSAGDEGMFVKSLPSDFFLSNLSDLELDTDTQNSCTADRPEERDAEEPAAGDQRQGDLNHEDRRVMKEEEEDEGDQLGKHNQSKNSVVEVCRSDREPADCWVRTGEAAEEPSTMADLRVEEEKEAAGKPHSDRSPRHTDCWATQETGDVSSNTSEDVSVESTEHLGTSVREDAEEGGGDEGKDRRDGREEMEAGSRETKQHDEHMLEEGKGITDKNHEEEMHEETESATCTSSSEIWEELQDVICEVIEDEESEQAEREGVAEEEQKGEETEEVEEDGMNKTEIRTEVEEELMETTEEKLSECEEMETYLLTTCDLDVHHRDRDEATSAEQENERGDEQSAPKEVKPDERNLQESDISQRRVGRRLVISKSPKVYQVKAVPVVPPKPQHCKLTALTLRQQQREREGVSRVPSEQDKVCAGEAGRDGGEALDTSRNSPLSMCFDEAVAKATMRREKEKECEKERQREWGNEVQ